MDPQFLVKPNGEGGPEQRNYQSETPITQPASGHTSHFFLGGSLSLYFSGGPKSVHYFLGWSLAK